MPDELGTTTHPQTGQRGSGPARGLLDVDGGLAPQTSEKKAFLKKCQRGHKKGGGGYFPENNMLLQLAGGRELGMLEH